FAWLLLRMVKAPASLSAQMLKLRPLVYIGKVSYGFFFHSLVGVSLSRELAAAGIYNAFSPLGRAILFSTVSIAVAMISWHRFEQPLNRWVRRQEFDFSGWWPRWENFLESMCQRLNETRKTLIPEALMARSESKFTVFR